LQTIQEAEGYALDRVNRAEGDGARFVSLYGEYRKAPEVTRTRIYLETMKNILPGVERKIIVDSQLGGILPLLNLDKAAGAGGEK
jgi:membrane protease subunit HflK